MPEFHALAVQVKSKRNALKQTQEEFSYQCGISSKTLSNIECEREETKICTVQKIAAYTGDTVSELLNPNNINSLK